MNTRLKRQHVAYATESSAPYLHNITRASVRVTKAAYTADCKHHLQSWRNQSVACLRSVQTIWPKTSEASKNWRGNMDESIIADASAALVGTIWLWNSAPLHNTSCATSVGDGKAACATLRVPRPSVSGINGDVLIFSVSAARCNREGFTGSLPPPATCTNTKWPHRVIATVLPKPSPRPSL